MRLSSRLWMRGEGGARTRSLKAVLEEGAHPRRIERQRHNVYAVRHRRDFEARVMSLGE